jgi:hypothetical protein
MPDQTVDPAGDPRFTFGLVVDVSRVIEGHGYPEFNGGQLIELQLHLFHLLHGDPANRCAGGAR